MMAELAITITTETELDYDDISETTKHATATIDGVDLCEVHIESDAVADATIKTNFKARLTAMGYTWDTEV